MSTAVAAAAALPATPMPSPVNPLKTETGALYAKVFDAFSIG